MHADAHARAAHYLAELDVLSHVVHLTLSLQLPFHFVFLACLPRLSKGGGHLVVVGTLIATIQRMRIGSFNTSAKHIVI
eukprot:m.239218 g.239218  ORF g.239218 m.239218 type:complete len:79 (-) comp15294_c0_seq2:306-542(-)